MDGKSTLCETVVSDAEVIVGVLDEEADDCVSSSVSTSSVTAGRFGDEVCVHIHF